MRPSYLRRIHASRSSVRLLVCLRFPSPQTIVLRGESVTAFDDLLMRVVRCSNCLIAVGRRIFRGVGEGGWSDACAIDVVQRPIDGDPAPNRYTFCALPRTP